MATREHTEDPIPEPDAPASASERAQAASLADLVERVIARADLPPAMASEERALVEAATMIHAATHEVALDAGRQATLIERALEQALPRLARADSEPSEPGVAPDGQARRPVGDGGVVRLDERRDRRARRSASRVAPWVVAAMCAAAAVVLAVRPAPRSSAPVAELAPPALAPVHTSRPADDLIGEIAREDADGASARVDVIYTDRMAGYRDLTLRGGRR